MEFPEGRVSMEQAWEILRARFESEEGQLQWYNDRMDAIRKSRANLELHPPAVVEMYRALDESIDRELYGINVSVSNLDSGLQEVILNVDSLSPDSEYRAVHCRLYLNEDGELVSADEMYHSFSFGNPQLDDHSSTQLMVMNSFIGNDGKEEFLQRFRATDVGRNLFEIVEKEIVDWYRVFARNKLADAQNIYGRYEENPNITVFRNLDRGPAKPVYWF